MNISCTPVIKSETEIRESICSEGKFNLNWLFTRNCKIRNIELRYVEYFMLKYNMVHNVKGFSFRTKKQEVAARQPIYLLGNGSTGAVSYMEIQPKIVSMNLDPHQLQPADYSVESMNGNARLVMMKVFRRTIGGRIPSFELVNSVSFYRPFWLIYYDKMREDGTSLCAVRAADGYSVQKF